MRHLSLRNFVPIVSLIAGLFAPASATESGPTLLLNRADVGRINAQAATDPRLAEVRNELLRRADEWPAAHVARFGLKEWSAPWERGGWSAHYICPEHGVRLVYSATQNLCPVCQKDFHGWPYDYQVFAWRHEDNAESARNLGVAYLLTGNQAYAAKAKKILLAYAEIYPALSIGSHKDWPRPGSRSGGRVSSQTLDESDWVTGMAFAYDLIRGTLTDAERAIIERDVLRSASDVIARRVRSLGNWTARHNMAHLAVGLAIQDRTLIDLAVNSEFGLRDQLRRSITAEGVWHEGSWGYHFYALSAIFLACEMADRAGLDLPERDKLRLVLDAPLASALPDQTLPNFNDSHFTPLVQAALSYEMGFRRFGDPRYARVSRAVLRSLESLLWGADIATDAAKATPPVTSEVLPDIGFATLRAVGSDHTVAVKFGPHAGGHSHFDRLNFISYAYGRVQAVDPGTQYYSFPTYKTWDRVTVAHNTIVVDETSQAESVGRLLEWHPGPEVSAIRLEDTTSYPGVRLERLLVHTADYTLDVFAAEATDGRAHRFDWIYHNAGISSTPLALKPYAVLPQKNGYQHLSNPQSAETAAGWSAVFTQKGSTLHLRMLGAPGTTVVMGTGMGQDLSVPVPFAMARREGTKARFVTLLVPTLDLAPIIAVQEIRPGAVQVSSPRGVDEIVLAAGQFKFTREPRIP